MSTTTGITPFSAVTPASVSPAPASPTSNAALTSENTFLKLLVAQIKNQDPTNPTDPTQFVAQLTQYSELEQLIQINGNVKSLGPSSTPATPSPHGAPPVPQNPVSLP